MTRHGAAYRLADLTVKRSRGLPPDVRSCCVHLSAGGWLIVLDQDLSAKDRELALAIELDHVMTGQHRTTCGTDSDVFDLMSCPSLRLRIVSTVSGETPVSSNGHPPAKLTLLPNLPGDGFPNG